MVQLEGLSKLKKLNDLIRTRTRNLSALLHSALTIYASLMIYSFIYFRFHHNTESFDLLHNYQIHNRDSIQWICRNAFTL
jgi:hypothetical protein